MFIFIKNAPMQIIHNSCFSGNANLKRVVLNSNLEIIGDYAFYGCSVLEDIVFPNMINEVRSGAFAYCVLLKDIILPSTIDLIGDYAFRGCEKITHIHVYNALLKQGVFIDCIDLEGVRFSNGTQRNMGSFIFQNCSSLKNIFIPSSVRLSNNTFSGCSNIKVRIEGSATRMGSGWKLGATNLSVIDNYPASIPLMFMEDSEPTISDRSKDAFYYNTESHYIYKYTTTTTTIVINQDSWIDGGADEKYYMTRSWGWPSQLDGVEIGDKIEFKAQSNASQNGFYRVISDDGDTLTIVKSSDSWEQYDTLVMGVSYVYQGQTYQFNGTTLVPQ